MALKNLTLLLLLGSSTTFAQSPGEIHGKVLDAHDRSGMAFAVVRAMQADRSVAGTESDPDGRFVLKPLPPGTYDVTVTYTGMPPVTVHQVRVDPGLNVTMRPILMAHQEMAGIDVLEYRWEEPLIRVDDPSRMVITQAQIKSNATRKDPVKLITSLTPGITRAANSDDLYFRGSRSGAMAYFVDGVRMTTLTGVPPDAINSVSVYTGGLPARYGDVTGGVVAIETKSYFDLYQQRNLRD